MLWVSQNSPSVYFIMEMRGSDDYADALMLAVYGAEKVPFVMMFA